MTGIHLTVGCASRVTFCYRYISTGILPTGCPSTISRHSVSSAARQDAMAETIAVQSSQAKDDGFLDVSRTGRYKGRLGMLQNDIEWVRSLHIHNPMMESSTTQIKSKILCSNRVRHAIQQCQSDGRMTPKQCKTAANSILNEMVAAVRPSVLYPLGMAARPLCRYIYGGGINVNKPGIQKVQEALKSGPVILLPIHRSHMDYIAIQFAAVANGLPVPFVIAGDNLNFPIIGRILKNAGAVFIRRSFGADLIYWAVFTEYISQILQAGCLLECFIEGGRSRSGKSIQPKSGFLEVIVQILASGAIPDVTLVPVGIAYDRMVEGKSFVKEMLGSNKEKESLSGFLHASAEFMKMHLGSITISDKFLSLRSFMSSAKYQLNSDKNERLKFISALSHTVLYEANLATTVTASTLIAAVLLTSRTRGITRATVIERTAALIDDLRTRDAPLSRLILTHPLPLVVDGALNMLGRLVTNRNGVLFGYWHMESLELGIYRNAVIHWWASEAVFAVALVAVHRRLLFKIDGKSTAGVAQELVLEKVRIVSQLLKTEFIYKPSFNIENNLAEIVSELKKRAVIGESRDGAIYIRGRLGVKYISFLCMLIWPLIDVYYICCTTLMSLPRSTIIQESALIARASASAEASYYKGEMAFYESVSTDSIKHALKWFESKGVIALQPIISGNPNRQPKLYTLAPEYCPETDSTPSSLLRNLADSIKQFRAETPDVDQRHFTLSSRL